MFDVTVRLTNHVGRITLRVSSGPSSQTNCNMIACLRREASKTRQRLGPSNALEQLSKNDLYRQQNNARRVDRRAHPRTHRNDNSRPSQSRQVYRTER